MLEIKKVRKKWVERMELNHNATKVSVSPLMNQLGGGEGAFPPASDHSSSPMLVLVLLAHWSQLKPRFI